MATTTIVFPTATTAVYNDTLASFISGTTVSPAAPGTFVFRKTNSAGAILTASSVFTPIGSYTIYCAFTSSNTANFKSSTGTKTVTVGKATPTITMSSTNSIAYGTTLASFISTTTASVAGTFTFRLNDAAGQLLTSASVLNAATYTIFCAFTPTDTTNYNSTTATKSLTVTKLSTTVTMSSTTSIAYGTTMSGFISTTTASVAGTLSFSLNDASGQLLTSASVLNAATYTIFCAFTPTDTNYASSTATKSLTVTKLSTSVTMSSTNSIAYGTTMSGFISTTTASVAGSFIFRLNDASGQLLTSASVLNAATYTIFCAFTPTDTNNASSTATKSLTVTKLSTTVTMSSTNNITYSTTMSGFISSTTASVAGSFTFSLNDASGQLITGSTVLNAAIYTIFCAFTPTDATNYLSSTATKTLTVQKKSTTVIWGSSDFMAYGAQLSVIMGAADNVDGLAGTYSFFMNDALGELLTSSTVLNVGTYTIFCLFTPTDTTNYLTSSATCVLLVEQQVPNIYINGSDTIVYGTNLSSYMSNVVAQNDELQVSVPGTFVYNLNDANGNLIDGSITSAYRLYSATSYIEILFTPTDTDNYTSSSAYTTVYVLPQLVTLTLASLNSIVYGTTFASFIIGTVATSTRMTATNTTETINPFGSFKFNLNDASGQLLTSSSVLSVGTYTIFCRFTPFNLVTYTGTTATKTFTVQKATPTITLSSTNSITYGTTLSSFISSTTASVAGTFSFRLNDASGQLLTSASLLNVATYTIFCAFTPTDTTNYNSTTATKSLTITQQSTSVTMSSTNSIVYGTTMSGFISTTTASVAGTFSFRLNDASGQLLTSASVLNAATYTIFCAFTPTDTTNYAPSTATKSLTVTQLSTTVTMSSTNSIAYGTTMSGFISTTTASVAGSFIFRLNDASGQLLTSVSVLNAATYTIFCAFTPTDATNYASSTATKSLTVTQVSTTITLSSTNSIAYGTTMSGFISSTTASVAGTFSFRLSDASGQLLTSASVLNAATYTIFCAFTPTNTTNYLSSTATKTLTVTKLSTTVTLSSTNSIVYGTTLSGFISSTTASVAGSFTFRLTNASGQIVTSSTVLNAATYTIFCAFTPTNTTNYNSATASKSLVVNKGQVNLTYSIPENLSIVPYGTQLSSGQLSAVARDSITNAIITDKQVTYTFSSSDLTKTVTTNSILNSGTYYLFARFTDPSNNYNSQNTFTVNTNILTVTKVKPVVTVPNVGSIVYGTTLDSLVSGTTNNVPGSLRFFTTQ
jgi:hypothetical protein